MVALHQRALSSIREPQLVKWGQVSVISCNTVTSLENAGQRKLFGQYKHTQQELMTGVRRLEAKDQLNMDDILVPSTVSSKLLERFSTETCEQTTKVYWNVLSAARAENSYICGGIVGSS